MSEFKPVRLIAAAKTLNVGTGTIIDFLRNKGFEVEDKPTTKLDEDMYMKLLKEFGDAKMLKETADNIQLGNKNKNVKLELTEDGKTKTVEVKEELVARPRVELSGPKVVGNVDLNKEKAAPKEEAKPVVEAKPAPKEEAKVVKPAKKEVEEIKADKPRLAGPKIVGHIKDKEEEAAAPAKEEPIEETAADKAPEVDVNFIETKKVELKGTKVLGKIELKDTRPKAKEEKKEDENSEEAKRKRKRFKKSAKIDPKKSDFDKNKVAKKPEEKVVSEKEIEEKLKATMAKLQAATSGKSNRQKLRRAKRQGIAEAEEAKAEARSADDHKLKVTEFITVSDLAHMLDVKPTEIITKCFTLGVMVSINQRLDAEIIELIAAEYDFEIEFISAADQDDFKEEEDLEEDLLSRAPVVTIMGHVDHGKTSLLDYIRHANVAAKEAGGITQHIGAYEVEIGKGKITFLDTPGHEAFTAMRARGAKLTDIAVIVIAADDDIMPQTKEAISHAQSAGVPMIFAINKIDKPGANPDNIKNQLSHMNLIVEEWGGKFQSQDLSAKKGTNVDLLLEKILLEAELLDLKANPNKAATGAVIEASLDKGRGYVATLLVDAGTLKVGDFLVAGSSSGKIKAMFNHKGEKVQEAGPAQPVQILGLDGAPPAGERFKVFPSEQEGKAMASKRSQLEREHGLRTQKHITLDEIGRRLALGTFKELNIIIKGDVDGSIEALSDSLQKLSTEEIQVNILHKGVGGISESDIMLASASDAIIIGFQVRPSTQARKLAENEGVEIRLYSVIYKAIEEITAAMEGMLEPTIEEKITGNLEIQEVFKITKVGTVAGCIVTEGKIKRDSKIRVIRDGIVQYSGQLASLKRFKDDVKEVVSGQDCGLNIKNFNNLEVGDIIEAYTEIEVQRTL
ncbi:MAG: translation initiation factor IF-2 [Chitinophagales bacterium]|nr:translation initiation factor IF-2 [Chitinophagales bacterium]